jgi:glycosyltransferase involved in cell wall biosynthesis
MWFGGGGAVLKGLDLVLEAFAELPEYELIVIGPAAYEPAFAEAYAHELSLPHIRRYPRPRIERDGTLACAGVPFIELAREASAIVYPTASDGTSGSIVQAMHTGLIPLVTRESGMLDDAPVTWIEPSIDAIRAAVRAIAGSDPMVLAARSRATWEFAQARHTKAAFSEAYGRFIDTHLLP